LALKSPKEEVQESGGSKGGTVSTRFNIRTIVVWQQEKDNPSNNLSLHGFDVIKTTKSRGMQGIYTHASIGSTLDVAKP
jgi:hypothetical protein